MRDMRDRLKSAGEKLREFARFPAEPAAFLRQKADALRERAHQWRAGRMRTPADEAPPRVSVWRAFAADSAAVPAASADTAESAGESARPSGLANALRMAGIILAVFLALPYFLIPFYRFIDPPFSALMARQFLTGTSIHHRWVDLDEISPALPAAVVISEDAGFCRHWGVDWRAVVAAIDDAGDGDRIRGASTIPRQTAKNLFLWNGFSFVRKVLEVPLAYYMSILWPKQRVLEIYLNIAEWGPGIFGAEAAARYHFGKSAAQLSSREAALLAASLPNPIRRKAGRPNGMTARLAARLQARVGREAQDASCVLSRSR
jgi:monofunctional biosynthetic peptidoglycan transglycosylase